MMPMLIIILLSSCCYGVHGTARLREKKELPEDPVDYSETHKSREEYRENGRTGHPHGFPHSPGGIYNIYGDQVEQSGNHENDIVENADIRQKVLSKFFGLSPEHSNREAESRKYRETLKDVTEVQCNNHVRLLTENVKCKPRKTLMRIKSHHEEMIAPNLVEVNQCGGSCGHLECVPSNTERKPISVQVNGERCEVRYVEEHTECECACRLQCEKPKVLYKETCSCECPRNEMTECILSEKKMWNWEECSCGCRKQRKCRTGKKFNTDTCRCK